MDLKDEIRNLKRENFKLRDENNSKLKEMNNIKDLFRQAGTSIELS